MELLEREAQNMPEALGFLSSHPLTRTRIEVARRNAARFEERTDPGPELERLFQELKAGEGVNP